MDTLQKTFHIAIATVLLGIFLVSCAKKEQTNSTAHLVLGAVYSLSGNKSDLGVPSSKGAQLAIKQLNAGGGIAGRKVTLILQDGKSDSAAGGQAVEAIIDSNPEIPVLFGLTDSDLALDAGRASAQKQRVFLTSGATSPLLPAQVPDFLYLACFGDNVQAAAAAEWAYHSLHARTVAVIYDSAETYTILLHKYFIDRFQSLGGKVLAVRKYDPADMSLIGHDLPLVDLIFLSAEDAENAQQVIHQLRAAGINIPVLGGDGYDSEKVWEAHPEMRNIFYTTHVYLGDDNPDSRVRTFSRAYHETYGGNSPDAFAALGFDAVNLLAEAITRAGETSPDTVRLALAGIDGFQGVTGTISYAGGLRIPRKSVTIIKVENGKRNFVTSFMPDVIPEP